MAGYTRQTTFVDAATIEAADHNNEFNQVQSAFSNTTGHRHDGTAAEGPVINVIGDAGLATPLNKVLVDTTNDRLEFWIDVASSSVEQVYVADGVVAPVTNSDVDLGTNTERFKDVYADTLTLTNIPWLAITNNLSDLNDAATARTNLGVSSTAETLLVANNLSDLNDAATARTNLGVDAAGTDNSTDVTLAGTSDYLTLSGQELTLNQIDLTADVTGALPATNGGGVVLDSTIRTSDPTAVSGTYYMCDTSSAGFTITFPASPSVGDLIGIMDIASSFGSNNLTIGRNGNNVFGAAENGTLDIKGYAGVLVYTGATYGWMPMF